jgi:hypothetical protein
MLGAASRRRPLATLFLYLKHRAHPQDPQAICDRSQGDGDAR